VVSVILFHLGLSWLPGGFVGVDVFFVISGYLITGLIIRELRQTGRFDFGRFYLRRSRRLFPALWFTTAATLTIGALMFPPEYMAFSGRLRSGDASQRLQHLLLDAERVFRSRQ
jgi:peptidoglycan/LPS O-acetylase OafA/YrhL